MAHLITTQRKAHTVDDEFALFERDLATDDDPEGTLYGIRIKFHSMNDDTAVVTAPWLTTNLAHAQAVKAMIVAGDEQSEALMQGWTASGDMTFPKETWWTPIAARVVKLAVVPF